MKQDMSILKFKSRAANNRITWPPLQISDMIKDDTF